jgi:hypothetical protein
MRKPEDKLKVQPKRVETLTERAERLTHLYDDGPKPKHYDDKSIVDMEKWNSMKGLEKKTPVVKSTPNNIAEYLTNKANRPKPFKNEDPSTYPMNQKKTLNTWEAMLEIVKNPKTPEDRKTANEYKRMINRDYYNPKRRGSLSEESLKFIGKHPSQIAKKTEIKIPTVDINYKPFVPTPTPPVREVIKNSSRFKPGLSEDLLSLNSEIQKNLDYVLGKNEERSESTNEEEMLTPTNKEETYDR